VVENKPPILIITIFIITSSNVDRYFSLAHSAAILP